MRSTWIWRLQHHQSSQIHAHHTTSFNSSATNTLKIIDTLFFIIPIPKPQEHLFRYLDRYLVELASPAVSEVVERKALLTNSGWTSFDQSIEITLKVQKNRKTVDKHGSIQLSQRGGSASPLITPTILSRSIHNNDPTQYNNSQQQQQQKVHSTQRSSHPTIQPRRIPHIQNTPHRIRTTRLRQIPPPPNR